MHTCYELVSNVAGDFWHIFLVDAGKEYCMVKEKCRGRNLSAVYLIFSFLFSFFTWHKILNFLLLKFEETWKSLRNSVIANLATILQ